MTHRSIPEFSHSDEPISGVTPESIEQPVIPQLPVPYDRIVSQDTDPFLNDISSAVIPKAKSPIESIKPPIRRRTIRKFGEVASRQMTPEELMRFTAMKLAGGDERRITQNSDGTFTVGNPINDDFRS